MLTILAFIVVLGVTVAVHEFGHFAMAKLLRIRVDVFSIGFGHRLFGYRRGGTDYRISAFPIGGYVKLAGENFDENRQGAADEFLSHPRWHRLLVYIAGPFMNLLLAVAILTYPFVEGVTIPRYLKQSAVVGPVIHGSAADKAGLLSGDRILFVRGSSVNTWEDLEITLATSPKEPLDLVVLRGASRMTVRVDPGTAATMEPFSLGFRFSLPRTIVAAVDSGSPAEAAGLKAGDEILAIQGNGRSGRSYDEILNIISASPGIPLRFEIRRAASPPPTHPEGVAGEAGSDQVILLTITPVEDQGRIVAGFRPEIPTDVEKYALGKAVVMSIRRNLEMSALTFRIIGRIFTGSASVRTLSGPLEIARFSGNAARTGSARVFLGFLGMVSLQLGLFNLLPVPILDGGAIALLLVESVLRRDLSLKLKERIVQVGFVFLIVLMGFVVVNDLSKIVNLEKLFR